MDIRISKIICSKRKTIELEVKSDACLVVRAPYHATNEMIERFVTKKKRWIDRKQKLAIEKNLQKRQKVFVDGEDFLYLGETYKLKMVEKHAQPLDFKNTFILSKEYIDNASEVFIKWYKEEAQQKITERVELCSAMAGLRYKSVNITNARQRWGSCGQHGSLNFSWRLIMAPLKIIDYVVAHEVAHLAEKNHSKRFWRKVAILFPEYEKAENWLEENGHLLAV
jgi:hypothetical protein